LNCEAIASCGATDPKGGPNVQRPQTSKDTLKIAIGSCEECKLWVEMSRDEGFLSPEGGSTLSKRFKLVGAMLTRLWEQWKKFKP
jgi:four helix bundle protein